MAEEFEFALENLECPHNDLLRRQGTSALHREREAGVVLADADTLGREANFSSKPCALLAKRALISVLDLNSLLQLVDAVDLARALGHELLLLLGSKRPVDDLMIDAYDRLLAHGTSGYG